MQMLGLRANLDKQTTQNNLNNMKLTRLSGKEAWNWIFSLNKRIKKD